MSPNFYVCTCVKFMFANKTEEKHEGLLVGVKVELRSTSRLSSAPFILTLFNSCDYNLHALTCIAKNV